jgi:hypoxanthine phosphoribosyltransferase
VTNAAVNARPPFRILLDHDTIRRRVRELARQIDGDMHGEPPCLVIVIEGARTFGRLLQEYLPGNLPLREIRAQSYGNGTVSSGRVAVDGGGDIDCRGRCVLLIEDIVDTGRTIAELRQHFLARGARAVKIVTLLTKPSRRVVEVPLDYTGFVIPDEFVIGFGMDLAGRYRELPDVVVYDEAVEKAAGGAQQRR